jgi:TonB-dependent SusC/RagA subfamily outer membrane receptor
MSDLLLYLIKANVALALFYLGYHFLLRKLTFYGINRYYLIFALVFSAIYPFISFKDWFVSSQDLSAPLLLTLSDWQQLQLPEEATSAYSGFSAFYWVSVGLFSLLLLIKLIGLGRIHFKSVPARWDRFAYRKSKEIISPFSFLTHIYFNPTMYAEAEYEKIFSHEQVHVRQLHSLDILLAEICLIFFWYNPFCWLIRRAIQENIEFITDQRVLSLGIDKKSYQYSLLQISTLSHPSYLGNHFNFKNLKKRIIMMNKKQSSKMQLGKYVLIIPAIVLGSFVFGVSKAYDKAEASLMAATQDTLRANDPIYVVDGNFISDNAVSKLDSTKIESIEVIKDAAAHNIYGTKAQNGIIKVTTQKEEPLIVDGIKGEPLYVVDGVKQSPGHSRNYPPDEIASVNVLKDQIAIAAYGKEGENGVIEITTKKENAEAHSPSVPHDKLEANDPIYIVDGKKQLSLDNIDPENIEAISVLKGKGAIDLYGEEGKNGAILVTTKKEKQDPVVEEMASSANEPSVKISTNTKSLTSKPEPDKEPVVMGIKNNKVTSLEAGNDNVLLIVDGKKLAKGAINQLDPNDIESISVFKGEKAIERYGDGGKDGVIEIITKSKN